MRSSGLLIVNADDLGIAEQDTDAILASFRAGTISSATGLVWMRDSERAAALAREADLPVGLHLNLIEPYTSRDVPAEVAASQRRVVTCLERGSTRANVFHRAWAADFERCIAHQLARFTELYGRPPTHVDGHRHMHLVPNALFARTLRPVVRCRRPVNREPYESRTSKRLFRAIQYRLMRLRFRTTDWCFSIRALDPSLGGSGLERRLALADRSSVEVMVHPGWSDERSVLDGARWRAALAGHRLGSFAEL